MDFYNRKFGIEFEFSSKYEKLLSVLKNKLSKKEFYYKESSFKSENKYSKKWILKLDYTTESELTTPIISFGKLKKVKNILHCLSNNNIKLTQKDSIHVHFDVHDISKENLLITWLYIEPFVFRLFPKHRRNSKYCFKYINKLNSKKIVAQFYQKSCQECYNHHQCFSLENYEQRKTVEFRLSEGSINYIYVRSLILLYLHILNFAKNKNMFEIMIKPYILYNKELFLNEFEIKIPYLIDWINERWVKYR